MGKEDRESVHIAEKYPFGSYSHDIICGYPSFSEHRTLDAKIRHYFRDSTLLFGRYANGSADGRDAESVSSAGYSREQPSEDVVGWQGLALMSAVLARISNFPTELISMIS